MMLTTIDIADISSDLAGLGFLMAFAFGTFCAYWAQETRRNPWFWFVFGTLLLPVAGFTLLYKNAKRNPHPRNLDDPGSPGLLAVRRDVP